MKQIPKEGVVLDRLRAAVGPDADVEGLAVFEAIALNQLPLRKRHPLYNGAVVNLDILSAMSGEVLKESRPLDVGHYGSDVPKGRVFYGEVVPGDAGSELRTLFWVSDKEGDLVARLDEGTIDQVSVGILPKQALCSSCGWDFLGEDSGFENIYYGECKNEHKLGENGVHAELHGLADWYELSLVGSGGAQGARVQSKSTSKLSAASLELLSSRGLEPAALTLSASPTLPEPPVTTKTDDKGAPTTLSLDGLVEKLSELATVKASKDALDVEVTALKAKVTELEGKLPTAELTARADAGDKAKAFLVELATKAKVAKGEKDPKVDGSIDELVASIRADAPNLVALVAALGNSRPSDAGGDGKQKTSRRLPASAFTSDGK